MERILSGESSNHEYVIVVSPDMILANSVDQKTAGRSRMACPSAILTLELEWLTSDLSMVRRQKGTRGLLRVSLMHRWGTR